MVLVFWSMMIKHLHHDFCPIWFPNTELWAIKEQPEPEEEPQEEKCSFSYRVFDISAYTIAADETGRGDGLTASGVYATPYYTAACNDLPFGTLIEIDGQIWEVQDRMARSGCIDLCMPTKEDCFRFGRKNCEVKIYERNYE